MITGTGVMLGRALIISNAGDNRDWGVMLGRALIISTGGDNWDCGNVR